MKKTALLIAAPLAFVTVLLGSWIFSLNSQLNERLSKEWFAPPVEFYYFSLQWRSGDRTALDSFLNSLESADFRERGSTESLLPKDFTQIPVAQCEEELDELEFAEISACVRLRTDRDLIFTVAWTADGIKILSGINLELTHDLSLSPKLIGEFQGGQPLKRHKVTLSQVPLVCLQSVTAIEDAHFLEHSGVSPSGIARALMRNLLAGRFAQGGSTITQQLVKNYFLTHEKTIKRKVTEQILSLLLETKLTKDQILEKYLNVIYMGQQGPYQIIGLGSAAAHYFGKSVSDLNLSECALLAALINNPGRYNPIRHTDNALQRRNLVLEKMLELGWISEEEKATTSAAALPQKETQNSEPLAPYFLELAYKELLDLNLSEEKGFRVYTSLAPVDQTAIEEGVREQLPIVRKRAARVKKGSADSKSEPQPQVEVAVLRVHFASGQVVGLIGGSRFRTSPYNRALLTERQIGSTIKPWIYWQAFKELKPWDKILDEPFTWKYDGRDWSPRNYDRKFSGEVFLFEALVKSLNVPAAKLAKEVGVASIRDTLYAAGLEKEINPLPSLALGALELTPFEVAQVFSTLGNMGKFQKIHSVLRVEDSTGELLHQASSHQGEERLDASVSATLLSTMKLAPVIGTAQALKSFVPELVVAGKTGTTNDLKDSWFVGLTRDHLMVVWVGRDDNLPTKLTGSSGALPIWGAIEKKWLSSHPGYLQELDFNWPENTETVHKEGYDFTVERSGLFF